MLAGAQLMITRSPEPALIVLGKLADLIGVQ
jgi:hypothetical protein